MRATYDYRSLSVILCAIQAMVIGLSSTIDAYSVPPYLSNAPSEEDRSQSGSDELGAPDAGYATIKRTGDNCPAWKPFRCPEGICIPLKYLCDYNVDCTKSSYDENRKLCAAASRPTVDATEDFLNHQLLVHGKNFFVKLFGQKAADGLVAMGGATVVAVALTESPRLEDFASSVGLAKSDAEHMRVVLTKISESDTSSLTSMGFKEAEVESLQPVVEQLVETGFLKSN